MNTINKRLITDLFEKKETAYDSNIYNKLYNDIWPCEDEFKQFLYATDSSVKINCAKNIFQYYLSDYDMIFPDFFIAEIVSIQQKDLKTTLGYVPQDHLVHSINLYILGIYSFFNIEVFHRKLLQEHIGESYIDQHKSFIKEWALFALYHDIGYVVEGNVDKYGIIRNKEIVKKYTNIYDTLLNKHIIQSVAKLITNIHIIKNCKNRYTVDKTEIFRYQWVINSKITDNNKLFKDLSCFSNHIELTLNSNNDIDFADWFLQSDDHLILYKDKDGIPIVFILVYKDKIKQIIYNSSIKSRYEDFINSILLGNNIIKDENILCYYYVGDIKNAITNKTPAMFQREIFDYYDCLPINIKNKISLSSNPNLVQNTYHTIYNWLKDTIKNRSQEKRLEQLKVATSKAITITVENEISKYISGICSQDISTKKKIDTLIKKLSNITEDEVDEKIRLIYNSDAGTSVPILNYYNYLMNASKQQITNNTTCIEIKDETINFKPLYCNSNSVILKKLYQHIDELSKQLNISLSELKKYRTDYTTCDHGLVSASLFFDIIAFKEEFLKLISQHPILGLSCSGKELTDKTIESYARIAFSILLHNVYVKSSKPWGVDYTHNIDINAFAYFGALMDSLQRWGRSKQLDYSVLSLPKEHFLEDDYDISFLNSNIIITCSITSSGNMRRDINTLESYLPGASHIIKIREIEE